ncbi:MAG: hypothetical protein ACRCY4_08625 [Brevinema sp.]
MPESVSFSTEPSSLKNVIFERMTFWQKIMLKLLTWFRKDIVTDYYTEIGLKQVEAELSSDICSWYDPVTKSLTPAFAEDLHQLVKILSHIVVILRDTIGNHSLREHGGATRISLVERIFCDLMGGNTRKTYPFTEKGIFRLVNNLAIKDIDRTVNAAVLTYLNELPPEQVEEVEARCHRLSLIDQALSVNTMDFLRRFNINATYEGTYNWDPLTINASGYYLEALYQSLARIEVLDDDFTVLTALQTTRKIYNSEAEDINVVVLEEAWSSLKDLIRLFQENNRMINLIRLAHHNLEFTVEILPNSYPIYSLFRQVLDSRLKAVVHNIARSSLKNEMKQLVQDVLPSSTYSSDLTDVGVFNIANSDLIYAAIEDSFRNVYAISLMQVFIVKFYKPWLKTFLGSSAVSAQLNQNQTGTSLNGLYKGLNKLVELFDKFAIDVHPKSSMGVRIKKLLDNPKLTRSDKHLLKVFTDSLNNQADLVVADFFKYFPIFQDFISRVVESMDSPEKSTIDPSFITKISQDPDLVSRIREVGAFGTSVLDLLNMSMFEAPSQSNSRSNSTNTMESSGGF